MIRLVFLFFTVNVALAQQNWIGSWYGKLAIQGQEMRLNLHLTKDKDTWKGTLDSPDQGAFGIPATKVKIQEDRLTFEVKNIGVSYTGVLKGEEIQGNFKQGGMSMPMALSRKEAAVEKPKRPQEPIPPFPYREEEAVFKNGEAKLVGTLTLPQGEGPFAAVVLVSGSGPQDRNEEILGHKPFLVIADHLTRNGIAVLRYDDRGTGQSSGVSFMDATSKDLMQDASAAVDYLQGHPLINKDKISVCGHSEGAMLAVMLGVKRRDLASIALLAGPGIKGDSLLLMQQVLIARSEGMKEKEIQELNAFNKKLFSGMLVAKDMSSCREFVEGEFRKYARKLSKKEIKKYGSKEKFVEISTNTFVNPWMLYFLAYDPTLDLTRVTCKVLAINGDKDLQVPSKENLAAIKRNVLNVTGNNKYMELPNLNHLFQETKTGAVSEYGQLEQTISPEVLNILSEWFQAP